MQGEGLSRGFSCKLNSLYLRARRHSSVKVCHCGSKSEPTRKEPAPPDWQAREAWYCVRCNGISHAVQEAVAVVRGPENARALLSASGLHNGQSILTWAVGPQDGKDRIKLKTIEYRTYPRRIPMSETEPLIFKTWELLMSKLPAIMDEDPDPWPSPERQMAKQRAKYEARGIAEVLAVLMKPFMESADHVVKCATKKYKDSSFEVPGLGEHLWDPTVNPDGSPRLPVAAPKTKAAKPAARPKVNTKSTKTLSAKEAEGIREAVSSGMFGKEEVASMFGVSMETLEQALSS